MKAKIDIAGVNMDVVAMDNVYQKPLQNNSFAKAKCSKFRVRVAPPSDAETFQKLIDLFNEKDVNKGVTARIDLVNDATEETITSISLTKSHIVEFSIKVPGFPEDKEKGDLTLVQNTAVTFIEMVLTADDYTLFGKKTATA